MRHSKIVGYVAGCVGILTVSAALAKEPAEATASASATPVGCTDSARGPAHVLRTCGDKHYWIKTAATAYPRAPGSGYLFREVAARK